MIPSKSKQITALVAFASLVAASQAVAALSFSAAQMTATSFSVEVSGFLPTEGPPDTKGKLFVVSASRKTAPYFVQPLPGTQFEIATSQSFSETQVSNLAIGRGAAGFEEGTIEFRFSADLVAGADFSGTLTATWDDSILVPSAVDSFQYYWGDAFGLQDEGPSTTPTGVLLGSSSVVPEPSAAALLLGLGALGLATVRRRTRV